MTQSAARKIEEANKVAEKAATNIDKTVDTFQQRVKRANEIMNQECSKIARKMVLKNYSASGIKTKSGKLIKAINEIKCVVTLLSRKPKITIHMPDNVADYSKKEGGGNFYKVANALNAGALRGEKEEKNKKRRKSIKKKMQKFAEKKKGKNSFVTQGQIFAGGTKTKSGSASFGGVSATKAYKFWDLTESQKRQLRDLAVQIFQDEVFKNQ